MEIGGGEVWGGGGGRREVTSHNAEGKRPVSNC